MNLALAWKKRVPSFGGFGRDLCFFDFLQRCAQPRTLLAHSFCARALLLPPVASCCWLWLGWCLARGRSIAAVLSARSTSSPELLERTCMMRSPCGHECARQTHVGAKTCVLHTSGSASAAKCSCPPRSGSLRCGLSVLLWLGIIVVWSPKVGEMHRFCVCVLS